MEKVTIDIKTRSAADLKLVGSAAYAQHSSTEVICIAVKCERQEPMVWYPESFRSMGILSISNEELLKTLSAASVIEAYDIQHEYFIWKYILAPYCGFPMLDERKLSCLAAKAASYGLPRIFELLCRITDVETLNDRFSLVMSLCRPYVTDSSHEKTLCWNENPEALTLLGEYSKNIVSKEEAVSCRIPDLHIQEQKLWRLDLQINSRGFRVNVPGIQEMLAKIEGYSKEVQEEFQMLTGLKSPAQREAFLQYMQIHGRLMSDLREKAAVRKLTIPADTKIKRILEIRQEYTEHVAAKYKKMMDLKGESDRIRGVFQFYGGISGEWTERYLHCDRSDRQASADFDSIIMDASRRINEFIVPAPGKEFIFIRYPDLEGRVLAWLTGDERALIAYRQHSDLYSIVAASILCSVYGAIGGKQRKIGRIAEQSFRYQGAVGSFKLLAEKEEVDVPEEVIGGFVKNWRKSRPRVVQFWQEIEKGTVWAFRNPGVFSYCRGIQVICNDEFLILRLPSGRELHYFAPEQDAESALWGVHRRILSANVASGRKWEKRYLYGGTLTHDIVRAFARDILASKMLTIEEQGYQIVRLDNEGVLIESEKDQVSVDELTSFLCAMPSWADGVPVTTEGRKGEHFR